MFREYDWGSGFSHLQELQKQYRQNITMPHICIVTRPTSANGEPGVTTIDAFWIYDKDYIPPPPPEIKKCKAVGWFFINISPNYSSGYICLCMLPIKNNDPLLVSNSKFYFHHLPRFIGHVLWQWPSKIQPVTESSWNSLRGVEMNSCQMHVLIHLYKQMI